MPRRIEALARERVVRVDANRWVLGISAVTTIEGAVLMFGIGGNRSLGLEDEENRNLPTRLAALGTGMAVVGMALGGDPDADDERAGWSVVSMGGSGIVGECLYRWSNHCVLDGVDPEQEEALYYSVDCSSVAAWPLRLRSWF